MSARTYAVTVELRWRAESSDAAASLTHDAMTDLENSYQSFRGYNAEPFPVEVEDPELDR